MVVIDYLTRFGRNAGKCSDFAPVALFWVLRYGIIKEETTVKALAVNHLTFGLSGEETSNKSDA